LLSCLLVLSSAEIILFGSFIFLSSMRLDLHYWDLCVHAVLIGTSLSKGAMKCSTS
jgi:hypothetical protein